MVIMNAKPEGLKKVYALPYWDEVEEEKEDYDFILEGSVLRSKSCRNGAAAKCDYCATS